MAQSRDPLLESARTIERNASVEARRNALDNLKLQKTKDLERSRILRLLKTSDIIKKFKTYAEEQEKVALSKIQDPSKREENETLETVAAQYSCHKSYLDFMDVLEAEGIAASERIRKYET